MELDPKVWGPHYWFTLHTIALCYPLYPNAVTKKKYYEFIQNLPLMIPVTKIGDEFSKIIDLIPVVPYLDSRESFIKWMHIIHNKVNQSIGVPELSMVDALDRYYYNYKPKEVLLREKMKNKEKLLFLGIIGILISFIIFIYKK